MTQALEFLKNLHFNGLPLTKLCNAWVEKSAEELCFMTLNNDAKFEGKMICTFKNDMRNLGNFIQSNWKSRNWDFDWILLSKFRKCMSLKFTGELFCHDNEKRCKIGRGIDFSFQNWHENFEEFWPEHSKITKICTLMGCLWPKYVMFQLKLQGSYVWWHWMLM